MLFSLAGFVVATYLTIEHYRGGTLACGPFWDCDLVTSSRYSEVKGIPIALGGTLYYLSVFLLCVAYFDTRKDRIASIIAPLTVVGFLSSLALVSLQAFAVRALCLHCMISALCSAGLFALAVLYYLGRRRG